MRRHKINARLGYKQGFQHGYNKGFNDGFDKGSEVAKQGQHVPFTGTSIIIPTYNKVHYLQECIESIVAYTASPYELIIVDNGSTDGTVQYLNTLSGQVQIKLNEHNMGFAGAVNQGLFIARGETLLILNNDAVVTEKWLENLLYCVRHDHSVGIVAPVTNYISGEQLIEVHYQDMAVMHEFARSYNQPDPSLWTDTTRLTGFCMLLRRDVFARLGYFDEGFVIGNCEDDDYGLRARLLGLRLTIAKDTFIHHYGSVSMKTLHTRFDEIYENNLQYYSEKWSDPHAALLLSQDKLKAVSPARMVDFYPSHVVVKAVNSEFFWLERGCRYLIVGADDLEAVRVSLIDLACWPLEGVITIDDYKGRYDQVCDAQLTGKWCDGVVLKKEGDKYQFSAEKFRRIISDHAYDTWFKHRPNIVHGIDNFGSYEQGEPIIAPIIIKADNI